MFTIKEKMKKLKSDLQIWNREEFGFINSSKQQIIREIWGAG